MLLIQMLTFELLTSSNCKSNSRLTLFFKLNICLILHIINKVELPVLNYSKCLFYLFAIKALADFCTSEKTCCFIHSKSGLTIVLFTGLYLKSLFIFGNPTTFGITCWFPTKLVHESKHERKHS